MLSGPAATTSGIASSKTCLADQVGHEADHDGAEEGAVGRQQHRQRQAADAQAEVVARDRAGRGGCELRQLHQAVRHGVGHVGHGLLSPVGSLIHRTRGMRQGSISRVDRATRRGTESVSCTEATRSPNNCESSIERV